MSAAFQGLPCWYELTTPDTDAARAFYGNVLGWTTARAPMEGMDYILASAAETMVAGMMQPPTAEIPPNWLIYFAVTDVDATVRAMRADGAGEVVAPTDIPGTGRFAVLTDPQGAYFGLLQPLPGGSGGAYDARKPGHGNWHELMSSDPDAGLDFYARHLGWVQTDAMDMGEMGTYRLVAAQGGDIGGIMGMVAPGMPPNWVPYFGVPGVEAAMAAITGAGGKILNGPVEVPGGAWIAQALDPQGAYFAVTGPR
jgi:hypothetical protein